MALAKTAKGTKLLIKVGDGATPTEAFAVMCTINAERGIQFTADTNDVTVPDCADPDLLAWTEREKRAIQATISGAGVLNTPDIATFFAWVSSSAVKNVKVVVDVPSADGGRIFSGAFHCTQFELTGNVGDKVQCSIQLQSSGAITIANNT